MSVQQLKSSCPMHALAMSKSQPGAWPARIGAFVYGAAAYAAFFATFMYAIGFVGGWVVPKHIDSGLVRPAWSSLAINAALLMVFVVQHTVMARPRFKRWWTRYIPASIERSTFVLLASASLALLFWLWQPLPERVWSFDGLVTVWGLSGLSLAGWATALASSFMVSHFDLFGLRQVWLRLRGTAYSPVGFRLTGLYRIVRHPLMLGFLVAFWATPSMSVGRLFFCIMTTAYIAFGVWMEERDLVAEHGDRYRAYRRATRAILPWPRSGRAATGGGGA